jgi:hypothetical protein
MEHRCGTRYKVDVELYARMCGGVVSSVGRLCEVSVSGGFVRTVLQVPPLGRVSLHLFIPAQMHNGFFVGFFIEGHVIRSTADGLGVEWSEDASELVRFLTQRGQATSATLASTLVPDQATLTGSR